MRITEAAKRLGMSPRMLRYRESLGLLPPVRETGAHRRFGPEELAAVAQEVELERRLDISPAELAFGLRVLSDPAVAQAVRDLGLRIGRLQAPRRALDFEKEKALRLLRPVHSRPVQDVLARNPGSSGPGGMASRPAPGS
ncbi:MerR family transcriptional regulator [Thermoactinospora rubra]|uniref:MerR family transcriptional regulator n=1 Tax=Thermoactinospora rubra TaxID=1088767 RepID=UPI001F0B5424|nr:MerR family transcriptional regulator [Thermoactinospora rubra]